MSDSLATALFHYQFCQAYGLSVDTFQFGQGYKPLGTESFDLWSAVDPIPPASINQFAGSSGSLFSQNYGATLSDLNTDQSLVGDASKMWSGAGGFGTTKGYTILISDVRNAIDSAAALHFSADTGKIDASARALLKSAVVAKASGQLTTLDLKADTYRIAIDAQFEHVANFSANPLNTAIKVGPTEYEGWYLNVALSRAFADSDGSEGMWKNPANWATAFGASGSLLRRCTSLVIVDGYTYTISATIGPKAMTRDGADAETPSATPRELIASVADLVPLGAVAVPSPMQQSTETATTSTQTFTSEAGNPVIFGFIVTPLPDYL